MSSSVPQPVQQAFIALGSNLDDPASHVRQALNELTKLPACRLLKHSAFYRTAPVGWLDQPDFINAVAQIETTLAPRALLKALLEIEHSHGRVREYPNAPRTLDLDILMYGDLQCDEGDLILPHPRMHQRVFVLQPLLEIAPDCRVPGHGAVGELLAACTEQRVVQE
ncbi:2-amino-4-hydroxy-6-hydroxymethyldihydropteridine diphosphokinase [Nitrosospira sp. NpAV]|uniref:2-amino-4-hydroxy-6- hydroxymethyldihydropteridine diphosphokinase n=1 Tax=Nitrosospira sp. NpAV TaxID=58133 RepID=UPI0005A18BEF|nr:2-amino-4-hydroxy-6-hydroxymethyldihydropteridine diphosphokinase [Nitrosospira sp. NpAV]KIO48597.1 2-amino-4-hydroxy-6-hydroxymethyldihydropteridine pyrophosphokinase [Nitrosospira sp. NpAV]